MPPVGRPLKHDGPACRVCGCTENNACIDRVYVGIGPVMCHWVKVEGATEPLCSLLRRWPGGGTGKRRQKRLDAGANHLY